MAYIESFRVTGLAGRTKPVEKNLDRHVNIFWGLNGSGKTSLLKILNSALRNEVASLNHVAFTTADVLIRTPSGAAIRRTLGSDSLDDDRPDYEEEAGTSLEPLGDGLWREVSQTESRSWKTEVISVGKSKMSQSFLLNSDFKHTYLPISRVSTTTRNSNPFYGSDSRTSSMRQAYNDAHLSEIFAEHVRLKWQNYNSESLSAIRKVQQQGLASILAVLFGGARGNSDHLEPTDTGENAYEVVTTFLAEQSIALRVGVEDFAGRYNERPELRTVVANIRDVTRQVEEILGPQREFQDIIDDFYSGEKHLQFEEPSLSDVRRRRRPLQVVIADKIIPLQSLSSGERQLLQLMLEILAAEDATVMIDEPELSMHVDWQLKLVHSMRRVNPHCQLLLATHSPEIMAEIDDEYVFEL